MLRPHPARLENQDNTLASALIDRLGHHAEGVVIEEGSYRMKERAHVACLFITVSVFAPLLLRLAMKVVRPRSMRLQTAVSLLRRLDALIAIKELMGHASITQTMRYAHLAPSNRAEAVEKLDRKPVRKVARAPRLRRK
jgi:integrase